jgi:L-seryl-tRNA(Ser) seleniumtransferase
LRKSREEAKQAGSCYVRAVNGTGIFLHTGLGRAPISAALVDRLAREAAGYVVLEVDPATGERAHRERGVVEILKKISGAEAGTIVNNNAAAVLLAASTLAAGGEVIVSRGELVEIGGGFRIPEVIACSGARLCEVGTTNRTTIEDFEAAITSETALLMRIHTSNFKILGDGSLPAREDVVALGRKRSIPVVEDLGGGLIDRYGFDLFAEEPTVREAIAQGVDVVTFSGDKLCGGPQAGVILGRRESVEAMRANSLFRAVRPDKLTLALLEQTFACYAGGAGELPDLPFFRALSEQGGPLRERAARLVERLSSEIPSFRFHIERSEAFAGSGSVPAEPVRSWAVAVTAPDVKAQRLSRRLRMGTPPVFATLKGDEVRIDMFALMSGDEEAIVEAFRGLSR